jgi:glycosyltransferase involved in cell wall biosynthesis
MRLAIVTPTASDSAVGKSTQFVASALSNSNHDILIVSSDQIKPEETKRLFSEHEIIDWEAVSNNPGLLKDFDVVYEIGNSFEFHSGALEVLELLPGVVVLHDVVLNGLLYGWHRNQIEARRELLTLSQKLVFDEGHSSDSTRSLISNATQVATHSEWARAVIQKLTDVPVISMQLPWEEIAPMRNSSSKISSGYKLLTIGHINSVKSIETTVEAIHLIQTECPGISLSLVGAAEPNYQRHISELANRLGVQVEFTGQVSQHILESLILSADAIVNLRPLSTESASASLLDALSRGIPTVVSNGSHFADLPDNVVFKHNPSSGHAGLAEILKGLVLDRDLAEKVGQAGRVFVDSLPTTADYAAQLTQVVLHGREYLPLIQTRLNVRRAREVSLRAILHEGKKKKGSLESLSPKLVVRVKRLLIYLAKAILQRPRLVAGIKTVMRVIPGLEGSILRVLQRAGI